MMTQVQDHLLFLKHDQKLNDWKRNYECVPFFVLLSHGEIGTVL